MERGRAYRRHQARRYKARAYKVSLVWWGGETPPPRTVGINYSTRCKPCRCWMCCNRRSTEGPTKAEKLAALKLREDQ